MCRAAVDRISFGGGRQFVDPPNKRHVRTSRFTPARAGVLAAV
jgi:hypothetical protein